MYDFLSTEKLKENPFFGKINISAPTKFDNNVDYYRVLDGVSPEITARLYEDLIIPNFAEEEREEKIDFQAFYEENTEIDERRENLNVIAVSAGKFVGLLTGMSFHNSKMGYFDYLVVDESARGNGIGSGLFQAGKVLMKRVAQQQGYDNANLAVLLTVEKPDSTMNLDRDQDPNKRLAFYKRQNCMRIAGMPCFVPGIYDAEANEQKPPIDCYDWLIVGVNRNFQDDDIVMNREKALKFNIDNIDLQYDDPLNRPAEETETYEKIKESLGEKIYAEKLSI